MFFAAIKLALHIAANAWEAHLGWGYFRDELYYIVCGQHLAWGYVDQGPVVALQARLGIALFGKSLVGIRLFSALAGAAKVFLTGLLAWSLGGRRVAQALAMLGVLVAPQFLGLDSFLSMNSFEPVFWMAALLAIVLILRDGSPHWWLLFGAAGGVGLENKPSMTFFLVALLVGLLLTPQRRILFSRWCAAAIVLMVLLALPNLLWQIGHHWATLEFLHNGRVEHKNIVLPPLQFIRQQIDMLHPLSVFLWGAGLIWLLVSHRAVTFRFLGWTYLLFLGIMMAMGAKDYYVSPIYPVLFAAGGVAWQSLLRRPRTRWIVPAYALLLLVTGVLILPMALPVFTPQTWVAYATRLHLRGKASRTENEAQGILPQFYADRFGWQELTDKVTRIYQGLSPADQAKAGILCSNYGEASAINWLASPGAHLPFAISGHNNYYLWGPHNATGEVMIVINGATLAEMRKFYNSVEIAGEMNNPYSMPYERRPIYLCRGRKGNLAADWLQFKHYI
ncbi:MAG: ArnT family glycosyltransferase [Acidobacteriaceae bacterium]